MLQVLLFLAVGFWSSDFHPQAFTIQLPENLKTGKGLGGKIQSPAESTNNLQRDVANLQTSVNKITEDLSNMSKTLTSKMEAFSERIDNLETSEESSTIETDEESSTIETDEESSTIETDEESSTIETDEESSTTSPCKEGFNYVSSSHLCLKWSKSYDKRSWNDSKTECEEMGARLVILNTPQKHNSVVQYLNNGRNVWVGMQSVLSGDSSHRQFRWTDGSSGVVKWAEDEPDKADNVEQQTCVKLMYKRGMDLGLADIDSSFKRRQFEEQDNMKQTFQGLVKSFNKVYDRHADDLTEYDTSGSKHDT